MAINLSKTDINRAATRIGSIFTKADTNHTGYVYQGEIDKFEGRGKAALNRLFSYAQHVHGGEEGSSLVPVRVAKASVKKIAKGLKNKADTIGNKDGRIQGSELKKLSESAQSLARFAHAIKD